VKRRLVFSTDPRIVSVSSGTSDPMSTTSAEIPSAASRSAASRALGTISARAKIVESVPSLTTRALPSSSTTTGSGSRTAATRRPTTSRGVEGATTLSPGIIMHQFSTL
jgi:hypothetical protein